MFRIFYFYSRKVYLVDQVYLSSLGPVCTVMNGSY